MSSRYQKEKRFRPRNDPYRRQHFNAGKYTRVERVVVLPPKSTQELHQQEPEENVETTLSGSSVDESFSEISTEAS